jgi:ribonucleoside-diphosphate reductase alpha chain
MGPKLPFSEEMHQQKYRGKGESFKEAMTRIASALRDNPNHFEAFRETLVSMRFLPAGRIQAAMGSTKNVTAYNCFVSGTIEDSFVDGPGNIMERATEAAATMRQGGGIGYDFSTLRPRGAAIKKLESQSSGPISFMNIFDAVCKCVASSGHRRGAQMGVLRVDHPDIEEFIHAKRNNHALTGFNVSIAITDEFMDCLESGEGFPLRFNGEVHRTVDAEQLFESIMRNTWDWAEPGVLFVDTINRMNNLHYCEQIVATNPCGEQPLPPYGACLLGSLNLTKYLFDDGAGGRFLSYDQMKTDIPHIVRAMDNVVDRARYPLDEQRQEAHSKRRMGIGVTGMANAIEALGFPYGSHAFLAVQDEVLALIAEHCYLASVELALEKGPFPLFVRDHYLNSGFMQTMPEHVREEVGKYGIRNSHLTSIAPTGTISLCADNVSSGIEPVFSYSFDRTVQEFSGPRIERVQDYGVAQLGVRGKRAQDVTIAEHMDVLATAARNVDSAVSKTLNVDSTVSWDDFKQIYKDAWRRGIKGCTTYRTDGKRAGILVSEDDSADDAPVVKMSEDKQAEPVEACYIDPTTGRRECE